jgi:predicted alpha/beta hydrolase
MRLKMTIEPADEGDIDVGSTTGLTQEAYDRLYNAVSDAGFDWLTGPERV